MRTQSKIEQRHKKIQLSGSDKDIGERCKCMNEMDDSKSSPRVSSPALCNLPDLLPSPSRLFLLLYPQLGNMPLHNRNPERAKKMIFSPVNETRQKTVTTLRNPWGGRRFWILFCSFPPPSTHHIGFEVLLVRELHCHTEIRQLHQPVLRRKDIGPLDIAM